MKKVRLQKYLAQQGINSRRQCEKLIIDGRVKVNDFTVTKLGTCINPSKDVVEVDNKSINQTTKRVYLMLNKPIGYLCTKNDPFNRPTIYDLIGKIDTKVNYAGRLDYLSEGLVLLTNDGELIYRMTHPSKKIEKVYIVKIKGFINNYELTKLKNGIPISTNFITSPCRAFVLKKHKKTSTLEVTISEGKKRQIRRMFSFFNIQVLKLKRIRIGPIALGNLKSGNYRHLSNIEEENLKNIS
jgi:23S rRNA pseudouridine2605 synthase